jgi:muramoyltetrapeptide carboxypeptidase
MHGPNKKIKIISPSGVIDPAYIDGAIRVFNGWGIDVVEGAFAREVYGRFAGTEGQRIQDLQEAIDDESLDAILCSRGGYGLAQIIDKIDFSGFIKHPKWLIGFSDVTVIHNVLSNMNIQSIHGVMAKHLTELSKDSMSVANLRNIIFGEMPVYELPSHMESRKGSASGKLIGGNLSVFMGLRGCPIDLNYKNAILFIEDIGERPYQIDRMLQNLRLGGVFSQFSGMIVGHFTDCEEDPSMKKTINQIILDAVEGYDFPVCFGFPSGHEETNYPLILGREIKLTVTDDKTIVDFS